MREFLTYTIYDHPSDYPELFVVRIFRNEEPDPAPFIKSPELQVIRDHLTRMGLMPIPRDETDAPSIIETWI
jgi:hypothetical protein